MPLSFTKRRFDGSVSALEVKLNGIVTLSDALLLRKSLRHTLGQGYTTLVVNLGRVRDIDPSAWDCLISAARRLNRSHGRIILRHCPDSLYAGLCSHQWDQCFLVPERRASDAQAVPAALREWAMGSDDPEEPTAIPSAIPATTVKH